LLLTTAGGYLRDQAVISGARKRWLELMRTQVAEDGSLHLEICRVTIELVWRPYKRN